MSTEGPARRREIEDSTAAHLAEIVAAVERAAKQVIDEAESEARLRLDDAHEEAGRIVAGRLAGLTELTEEIGAQAEALRRQAETLQGLLARAKAEIGGREADPEPEQASLPRPPLTVVGGEPAAREPTSEQSVDSEPPAAIGGTPAGARLLATQMAVSGSGREEIEARLRNGFAIDDTRAILDAILGPDQ